MANVLKLLVKVCGSVLGIYDQHVRLCNCQAAQVCRLLLKSCTKYAVQCRIEPGANNNIADMAIADFHQSSREPKGKAVCGISPVNVESVSPVFK